MPSPSRVRRACLSSGVSGPALTFSLDPAGANQSLGTYTRSGQATVYDASGTVVTVAADTVLPWYDPVSGLYRGWAFEEARTNVLLRSNDLSNASWTKEANVVVTANDAVAPDGTLTAAKYTNSGNLRGLSQTFTLADPENRIHWLSCFVKLGTLTKFTLNMRRGDASNAANITGLTPATAESATLKIKRLGSTDWYRYSIRQAWSASTTGDDINVRVTADSNDTGTMWVWGMDLEEVTGGRDYPSSHIPTTTAAATRGAPSFYLNPALARFNANQGTMWAKFTPKMVPASGTFDVMSFIKNADNTERHQIAVSTATILGTTYNSSQQSAVTAGTVAADTLLKAAYSYNTDSCQLAVGGVAGTRDTSASMFAAGEVDRLGIGSNGGGTAVLNGYIEQIKYWPKELPEATLLGLTM